MHLRYLTNALMAECYSGRRLVANSNQNPPEQVSGTIEAKEMKNNNITTNPVLTDGSYSTSFVNTIDSAVLLTMGSCAYRVV